jgi:hypothetical protein
MMYTAEQNSDQIYGDDQNAWAIFDQDGDWICNVNNKHAAAALLSHLNRG